MGHSHARSAWRALVAISRQGVPAAGELWVSAAVPMLVAGAGFGFDDRGSRELKGIEGTWQLWAVQA